MVTITATTIFGSFFEGDLSYLTYALSMARYGLFVLKVPLNPNQPTYDLSRVVILYFLETDDRFCSGLTDDCFMIIWHGSLRRWLDVCWCLGYLHLRQLLPGLSPLQTAAPESGPRTNACRQVPPAMTYYNVLFGSSTRDRYA